MLAFMNRKIAGSEVLYDRIHPEMSVIPITALYRRAINSFCSKGMNTALEKHKKGRMLL